MSRLGDYYDAHICIGPNGVHMKPWLEVLCSNCNGKESVSLLFDSKGEYEQFSEMLEMARLNYFAVMEECKDEA